MHNIPAPPELQEAFQAEQRIVLERLGDTPLSEIPSLSAWRGAFRGFGVEPTKYRSAAEALLRRLTKKGDIPSINALVDAYNLVSIRYAVPMAAFDTRQLSGSLIIRFADGSEWFTAHDEPEAVHPEPGEVIFVDETGLIFARRWCWKQSQQSTTALDTTTAIITSRRICRARRGAGDLIELPKYIGGSPGGDSPGPA
jgi:DNA/RNA-binding domain of Phe-tRNA-synthetase-like protein